MNDVKLLSHIYENSSSASSILNTLLPKVDNPAMRLDIVNQICGYNSISTDAALLLNKKGIKPKTKSLKNAGNIFSAKIDCSLDSSLTNIAGIIARDCQDGISSMSAAIERSKECAPEVNVLARRLKKSCEENLSSIKGYI